MFDIGFWELTLIAIIGIIVIGPQRLPEVVRTIAIALRKIRHSIYNVKADISRELDLDNLRQTFQDTQIQDHIQKLNQSILEQHPNPLDDPELTTPVEDIQHNLKENIHQLRTFLNTTPEQEQQQAHEQADTGIEPDPKNPHTTSDNPPHP